MKKEFLSRVYTPEYNDGWDRIFGVNKPVKKVKKKEDKQVNPPVKEKDLKEGKWIGWGQPPEPGKWEDQEGDVEEPLHTPYKPKGAS